MSTIRKNTIDDLWQTRNGWAVASQRFQAQTQFARHAQLGMIIAGAILATAAATGLFGVDNEAISAWERALAGLGAMCLTLVTVIQLRFLSIAQVERWPRARSVAEAIKSEVFRFQAGAHPYEKTETDEDLKAALLALTKAVDGHIALADDLLPDVVRAPFSSGGAPGPLDRNGYLRDRVDEQIQHFYLPRSRDHARAGRRARLAMTALSLAGAVISALMVSGMVAGAGAWVSVLTTVSLAISTHASLQRSDFLAVAYSKQARRLKRLKQDWMLGGSPATWTDFVDQCEDTISAENRAWMAEMVRELDTLGDVPIERPLRG
mgnify:CR=1 FL=1